MNVRPFIRLALTTAAALYFSRRFGGEWVRNWGARADEATMKLPGDDILPAASLQTTRAITVETSPEEIWPWLVQMGGRPRGGAYTYDWIERLFGLDIKNVDRILPEFQQLEAGEYLALAKDKGVVVREVDPGYALVLQWQPGGTTWTFALQQEGASTRLISRNRLEGSGLGFRLMGLIMEPMSLVMERKMLLGIKERAEKLARSQAELAQAGTWLERGAD